MSDLSFAGNPPIPSPLPQALMRASHHVDAQLTRSGFPSPCDLRLYADRGIPGVVFGPGRLSNAHGPDEYVEIAQVLAFSKVVATVLLDDSLASPARSRTDAGPRQPT